MKKTDLTKYDVYTINDGTTITLYWYEDRWCIATARQYEANDKLWIGPKTYFDSFMEASKSYPKFKLNQLDKSCSYSIGFRNKEWHPLLDTTTPNMWLIQIMKDGQLLDVDIGIPRQHKLAITDSRTMIKQMLNNNQEALQKYQNNRSIRIVHYGYILRDKEGGRDYVLESKLLNTVRQMIYNIPDRDTPLNENNRINYMVLKSFLCYKNKVLFIQLFPQFSSLYQKYDNIFKQLEKTVLIILKKGTYEVSKEIELIAIKMAKHIELGNYINPNDPNSVNCITDFIRNTEYTDVFFDNIISKTMSNTN